MPDDQDERYSEAETKRRMEAGLRRALTTPHKPNQAFAVKKRKVNPKKADKRKSR
jgi:hypothetical protein